MKTQTTLSVLIILAAFSFYSFVPFTGTNSSSNPELTKYEVNPIQSKLLWKGKKFTGEHFGNIQISNGYLNYDGSKIIEGEFIIDMKTISNTDVTDEEYNQKLVAHLKSDDFFSTEKFPTSVFKLTEVKHLDKNKFEAKGDLTIKGITHPLAFPVTIIQDGNHLEVKGKATVDRAKYDVKYGSGSFFENLGDKVIYDNFELEFNIVAGKAIAER